MDRILDRLRFGLPFSCPLPDEPRQRRSALLMRWAAYLVAAGAFIVPAVQIQCKTAENIRRAAEFERRQAEGKTDRNESRPKGHKGAVGRWRRAIQQFWQGQNIYLSNEASAEEPDDRPDETGDPIRMHPNMPFVVVALTPFALLPAEAAMASYNVLKLLALLAAGLMVVRVANHQGRRMPDWVLGLGLLWGGTFVIGDIQHGNTNTFVLAAVALHLCMYRRGRDLAAGAALAAGICLKLTPALFCLYWLYQRNWRLLAGTAAGLAVLAVVVPAAACLGIAGFDLPEGLAHYNDLTSSWLDSVILPGLTGGAWYPQHINQSLSGIVSRYFLGEPNPNGNIFWGPDDNPYHKQKLFGWIAFADLPEPAARWILRLLQAAVVAMMGWAIGWRLLPRDDGRRALHYALVVLGMMLLNQRTWDHHAAVLLVGAVAVWQAIAFGRAGRTCRRAALGAMLLAGLLLLCTRGAVIAGVLDLAGLDKGAAKLEADYISAYGPTFYAFLLMFLSAAMLTHSLRKLPEPYAEERLALRA